MPAPNPNAVPDINRWRPVQRNPSDAELRNLAANLVAFNGQSLAGNKMQVLNFLSLPSNQEADRLWHQLWVTIATAYGLAFIERGSEFCETTELARYLVQANSSMKLFFLLWGLRFQYPFVQNKQLGWKQIGKSVQPLVTLCSYLIVLADLGSRAAPGVLSFLTYGEVVRYIMPEMRSDFDTILAVTADVLAGAQPRNVVGAQADLDAVTEQFRVRLCSQFDRAGLLTFTADRIELQSEQQRRIAETWLRFRTPSMPLEPTEESRRSFFKVAFGSTLGTPIGVLRADLEAVGLSL